MANEIPILSPGLLSASADLSSKQHYIVKMSGDFTVDICSADTDKGFGVLQNAPKTDEAAEVMVEGITKVVAGGTITAGDSVGPDANGKAEKKILGTDTTKYVIGIALKGGAANEVITIKLGAPMRAS